MNHRLWQPLPLLICSGANGTFYEVTPWNAVIWEYVNPYSGQTPKGESNEVFTIRYYAPDYPGLATLGDQGISGT